MSRWKIYAILALFFSCDANAQFYSSDANPSTVESISVRIIDEATDGCWTNLREVREYAEEKLRIAGYKVVSQEGEYRFVINVHAFRLKRRTECVGAIRIGIESSSISKGVFGFHEIGSFQLVSVKSPNLNNDALDLINLMIQIM